MIIRRKDPRTSVRFPFCYFGDGSLGEGTIWNLSLAGWRSTGTVVVAPGLEVTAHLKLPDGNSTQLQISGAVIRWVQHQTMGWEITNMDESSRARLAAFLSRDLQDGPRSLVGQMQDFLAGLMSQASLAAKE
jgi:hypothetical protein